MSIFEFGDQQGVRTRGTLSAPGATPGDVLTVGTSRGTVSPAPGGGSMPVTESFSQAAPNSIADDTIGNAPVQHNDGDALLDYSNPTAPTVLADGLYAVTVQAACFDGPQPGGSWNAAVLLAGSITTQASTDGPLTTGGTLTSPFISVTAIGPLSAGDTITFPITNYSGAMGNLNLNVIIGVIVKLA